MLDAAPIPEHEAAPPVPAVMPAAPTADAVGVGLARQGGVDYRTANVVQRLPDGTSPSERVADDGIIGRVPRTAVPVCTAATASG